MVCGNDTGLEFHLLDCLQRELEYLAAFKTRKSPSPPSILVKTLKMVTVPSTGHGVVLEPFGKTLPKDDESHKDVDTDYGDQSISAALITDLYLSWVARDRNEESESYLKTLTGK